MSRTFKILLVVAGIVFLAGCQDVNWNWSDNRKRIKPGLPDIEIDQEVWNDAVLAMYMQWRLQQDQAEIDKIFLPDEKIADPNLP